MELVDLLLPGTNRFASAYYEGINEIGHFFHYRYQSSNDYIKRLEELKKRSFKRRELAEHIAHYMNPFPSSEKIKESIEKLKNEDSVVVIGGQQAGLLTGPLYSIHKVISIITLARQKERELGVPVVPIFWIAGEDHDFAEVNHIYQAEDRKLGKWTYPEKSFNVKKMITDYELDKDLCKKWVNKIIEALGESQYTKELIQFLETAIHSSTTFVDFFCHIIMELFKEHGLLLVDSGNKDLRKLEKDIFTEQIKRSREITEAVRFQQTELVNHGYPLSIEITSEAANLFYYDDEEKERLLLEHSKTSSNYIVKDGGKEFSYENLLHFAEETPHLLSNNVVTRPITQELLFPTLAFIAGPGEISYWAELKKAFELFEIKMPPIVPRISITFLEREIESDLNRLHLDLQGVLVKGIGEERSTFIESLKEKSFADFFSRLKETVNGFYQEMEDKLANDFRGLIPLAEKNQQLVEAQFNFMENKIEEALLLKNDVRLSKYDRIECSLRPLNGRQERTWNILYFLNRYGLHFLEGIMEIDLQFDGKHKVIKI